MFRCVEELGMMNLRQGLRGPIFAAALVPVLANAAPAETPGQICQRAGTDDALRPIPASLVPDARRLFGLERMPTEQVQRGTLFRCADRRVLVCNLGANLPCGKANRSRNLPGATAFCRQNPNSDFIPMVATGHDTIYHWRCVSGTAQPGPPVEKVDARGFIARYWKPVNGR